MLAEASSSDETSQAGDTAALIAFAAGNFIYIGASDLVPEVAKHSDPPANLVYFLCFVAGRWLDPIDRHVKQPRAFRRAVSSVGRAADF
jgi:hypothetical protein